MPIAEPTPSQGPESGLWGAAERGNPFVGLRPFEPEEEHLFFGREKHSQELLRRLRRGRFLAVVGTSGSGKSSLVRAGLLPMLYGGMMRGAGSRWRVALLRPGGDPIGELARALERPGVLGVDTDDEAEARVRATMTASTLRRSALGLGEAVRHARLPAGENLLVVVDQFEEIFRFRQTAPGRRGAEDSAAFIKLLLEASRAREQPIYVLLTMRSDFLGDCAQFRDLPEAINDGQFLIPRLRRGERRLTIVGPLKVAGAKVSPRLVQRLLNDVGDDPDQLPVLQHALMRTWDVWRAASRDGEVLDVDAYEQVGRLEGALSQHADEVYDELGADGRGIAETLFKALTDTSSDPRGVRRPARLAEVAASAGVGEDEVIAVVERFRQPGRSFLMPPAGTPLAGETVLDISHESLMRGWERLESWAEEERLSAAEYLLLARDAARHEAGAAGLLRDPALGLAVKWREDQAPTESWARRYDPAFERAIGYLEESRRDRDSVERGRRLVLAGLVGAVVIAVLGVTAGWFGWAAQRRASEARASSVLLAASALQDPTIAALVVEEFDQFAPTKLKNSLAAIRIAQQAAEKLIGSRAADWTLDARFEVSGEPLRFVGPQDRLTSASFSPDGTRIVIASLDGTARVWHLVGNNGEHVLLEAPMEEFHYAAFSPAGSRVLTSSDDGTVRLWQADGSGEPVVLWQPGESPNLPADDAPPAAELSFRRHSADFSPDGTKIVAVSPDGTVRVWKAGDSDQPILLWQRKGEAVSVAFSSVGASILTASLDGAARVWNAEGSGEPVVLRGDKKGLPIVAFHPDGSKVVTASLDGTAWVWNANGSGEPVALRGHAGRLQSVAFSPDGSKVVTASLDGTARVWDLGSGEVVVLRGYEPKSGCSETVGGPRTYSGTPVSIRLRYADLVETLHSLAKFGGVNLILQPGLGGSVSVEGQMPWDQAMELIIRISGLRSQRDGNFLRVMRAFSPLSGADFSPDGTRVVTASLDGSTRVWNVDGSGEPLVLGDQRAGVLSAAFSPDGTRIVTASADRSVRVWSVDWQDLIERLRPVTDACLTAAQRIRYLRESPSKARAGDERCRRERGLVSH